MSKLELSEKGLSAFPGIPAGTASLDVSDNALTEVPAAIGGAADLEELLLFKNKIKTVDKAIGSLGKLTTLNLFNNVCMKVPPEIGQLGALEELNMAANKMMMLSDAHFAGLTSLKILTLNDNRLVKMGSLANLKAIEEIRLYGNNLEEMPVIGNSPELKIVEMNGNRIASIPDEFFSSAPALERFVIHKNMLKTVPATICGCKALTSIQLQANQLTELPDGEWGDKIETFFVQENPDLKALPAGLAKVPTLKRVNVGKAGPDALADALKKIVISKGPQAMFWGKDGACVTG